MSTARQIMQWATAPTNHTALQVPRALVVSVLAAALDFGVLVLLVERFEWSPGLAAVVSYLLGGVLQYALCAWWVFPSAPQSLTVGIVAFTLLSLVGLGITWVTIAVLHEQWQVNYVLAKFFALGLAFAWNFLSRKYLLFGSPVVGGSREVPADTDTELMDADDLRNVILPFTLTNSAGDVGLLEQRGKETSSAELEHIEA